MHTSRGTFAALTPASVDPRLAAFVAERGKDQRQGRLGDLVVLVRGAQLVDQAAEALALREAGDTGRVLLRKSGTEPVVRVMVEAADGDQAAAVAERLVGVVRAQLSL